MNEFVFARGTDLKRDIVGTRQIGKHSRKTRIVVTSLNLIGFSGKYTIERWDDVVAHLTKGKEFVLPWDMCIKIGRLPKLWSGRNTLRIRRTLRFDEMGPRRRLRRYSLAIHSESLGLADADST
jgi:hypothetical protein